MGEDYIWQKLGLKRFKRFFKFRFAFRQQRIFIVKNNKFFGLDAAREMVGKYGKADLLIGNNVLAHVPDINDFVSGMKLFLGKEGIITMEFPHLLRLVEQNQYDLPRTFLLFVIHNC